MCLSYLDGLVFSDKPSPPQNLVASEVNKDHVTLKWEVPKFDGGSKITGYVIEKADTGRRTFMTAGTTDEFTLTFKVTKLVEGNEYLFKVSAENAIGTSDPATLSDPITAKLPFGMCILLVLTKKYRYCTHLCVSHDSTYI